MPIATDLFASLDKAIAGFGLKPTTTDTPLPEPPAAPAKSLKERRVDTVDTCSGVAAAPNPLKQKPVDTVDTVDTANEGTQRATAAPSVSTTDSEKASRVDPYNHVSTVSTVSTTHEIKGLEVDTRQNQYPLVSTENDINGLEPTDAETVLALYEERAAIIEFEGKLPRAEAERRAREEVRAQLGETAVAHLQAEGDRGSTI